MEPFKAFLVMEPLKLLENLLVCGGLFKAGSHQTANNDLTPGDIKE